MSAPILMICASLLFATMGVCVKFASSRYGAGEIVAMTRADAIGRPLTKARLQYLGIAFSSVYGVWLFHGAPTRTATAGIALIIGAGLGASRLRATTLAGAPGPLQPPPDS